MSPGALAALHVEAFSEGPGAGNGAAVVRLEAPVDDAWMQAVAGSLRHLASHCAGDARPDCPILAELEGTTA